MAKGISGIPVVGGKLSEFFANAGVSAGKMMGATSVSKYNAETGKVEEGTITADGDFRVSTQKELDAKTKAAADAKAASQNATIIKGGDTVNAPSVQNNASTTVSVGKAGAGKVNIASSRPK